MVQLIWAMILCISLFALFSWASVTLTWLRLQVLQTRGSVILLWMSSLVYGVDLFLSQERHCWTCCCCGLKGHTVNDCPFWPRLPPAAVRMNHERQPQHYVYCVTLFWPNFQ
jgi:hypothetical protein